MSAGNNPLGTFHPGDEPEGEAVRAHREAMEQLNPKAAPISGTPAKDNTVYKQDLVTDRPARIKGEKRIPASEIKKMTKNLGSAPVYDKGGVVDVDDADASDTKEAAAKKRPLNKAQQDTAILEAAGVKDPRVYDQGGKVNVNDGKHQVAIVKDGERVLTEKQNKEYESKMGGVSGNAPTKLPIGGKDMRDANDVTPEIKPTPKAPLFDKGGIVEHTPEERSQFHRAMSHLHGGALHRHFGIPEDQPIPMAKKQEAANSDNPHIAKEGHLAVAMHLWKHGKK
jgi:hypothetical protein